MFCSKLQTLRKDGTEERDRWQGAVVPCVGIARLLASAGLLRAVI